MPRRIRRLIAFVVAGSLLPVTVPAVPASAGTVGAGAETSAGVSGGSDDPVAGRPMVMRQRAVDRERITAARGTRDGRDGRPIAAAQGSTGGLQVTGARFTEVGGDGDLAYLSLTEHPYLGGSTRIGGRVVIRGPLGDRLLDLRLDVLDAGVAVASGSLVGRARAALGREFGPAGTVEVVGAPVLFEIPSVGLTADRLTGAPLTLRVVAGSERGRSVVDVGQVVPLVRYPLANRYGDRDPARGGDDWVRPGVATLLAGSADRHCYGDFSDMNGGTFGAAGAGGHRTHRDGVDVDVKFPVAGGCAAGSWFRPDAAGAEAVLRDLTDPVLGPRIGTVYVTFGYRDGDPFWARIRGVWLPDGRRACEVVRQAPGHTTHVHYGIDHAATRPGRCA